MILHWTDDVRDPQHAISLDALHRLETTVDARGRKLKVGLYDNAHLLEEVQHFLCSPFFHRLTCTSLVLWIADTATKPQRNHNIVCSSLRPVSLIITLQYLLTWMKVHKCLLPGPLYLSQDEVSALKTMSGSRQRKRGETSFTRFILGST